MSVNKNVFGETFSNTSSEEITILNVYENDFSSSCSTCAKGSSKKVVDPCVTKLYLYYNIYFLFSNRSLREPYMGFHKPAGFS